LIPTLEADDVMATLASKTLALRDRGPKQPVRGVAVTLVSTDKGFCQLLDEGECFQIWNPFAKQRVDAAYVREKYGMEVEQLCDYWALCGDSTNHISGAPGIGPKTARQLLNDYAGLEALYQHLDALPDRQQKQLREGRELAELAFRLVRLHRNEALNCRLRDFRLPSV
jgi:protein Xni